MKLDRTIDTLKKLDEEKWFDVKKLRKPDQPNHTKLKNSDGKVVTSKQRANVLAEHFEKKQWGKTSSKEETQVQRPKTLNEIF